MATKVDYVTLNQIAYYNDNYNTYQENKDNNRQNLQKLITKIIIVTYAYNLDNNLINYFNYKDKIEEIQDNYYNNLYIIYNDLDLEGNLKEFLEEFKEEIYK